MKTYNVAIVGGGPGGYVAAIRAAKEGQTVALIEADQLGGTCLNRGCIPSKTLLRHAEVIEDIRSAKKWGIETGELTFSLEKMMARKDQVIQTLRTGIASLLKAGKVDVFQGWGTVQADKTIRIEGKESTVIQADSIILATGSVPFVPPISGTDAVSYYTSDTIFGISEIPESIAIIGGGVIGVEFACIFESLGTKVTVVEMANRLVPNEDPDASTVLLKTLKKKGIRVFTDTKVEAVGTRPNGKAVQITDANGVMQELAISELLIAVGRRPNLAAIAELNLTMNGPFVAVNEYMETSSKGIYAVGDLIGGWQLAHVASAEGIVAALNASGHRTAMDYKVVPRCIYTLPEIASVGLTEEEARKQGYRVKVDVYRHSANGKSIAMDQKDGFVKLIADETYGEILGVVLVGPHVTEMISTPSAFIHLEGTVEEMANMIFPHPTVSETMFEMAAKWLGTGIHS
ncbi:dihydrolipoyl dehydrogenase [Fodinisporobacter ferrooxydans]|uniref:Dihydrolipoyl dehydrogenase n=1 Tax=Fodinisporobacter ferrooxydans TaxID=2901836 RepID=A0ABY4CME0_9BACL|nr:dihydrolipoyl dehydrogenase [Alicyclobacillaceae bacterium MYW30-H2]